MSSEVLLSVQDAVITFGGKTLFDGLTFHIHENAKICLVGKNGAGKTTLMSIIKGERDLDDGTRWLLAGTTIGYLQQEIVPIPGQTVFDFVFREIASQDESETYKVEMILEPLELDPNWRMDRLSGGQMRRAALARALVEEPDILLLDEPTNHLDLSIIEWLENYLKGYRGALVCVSHDKVFLKNISDRVFWLDRGRLKVCPRGFEHFDEWSQMLLEQEERELHNKQKLVDQEWEWASRGVKARRKRNQARLANVIAAREKLRQDKSAFRRATKKVAFNEIDDLEISSKIVADFHNVSKFFHTEDGRDITILENFHYKIQRGDRIGILGHNGSGKTSFIKLLVGELQPDTGRVKLARDMEISYFDQKRKDLIPEWSLLRTLVPLGGEHIDVMGKPRHVFGYLKDFMFDAMDAHRAVSTLSGGQKNRLLLAKILASPGSLLILDEPTNDLDMDTLEMLEDILANYPGTLIVVSHDRDFLDQTVTKILAFEGKGVVEEHIGGYSDYIAAKGGRSAPVDAVMKSASKKADVKTDASKPAAKLSYKLQYELDHLPVRIADLEKEIMALEDEIADPDLFARDARLFHEKVVRLEKARRELEEAELRWLELDEMSQSAAG